MIDSEKLHTNNFKEAFEGFLFIFELGLLLGHEFGKLVEGALLDLSQDCARDDFELVHHLGVTGLEVVDLLVVFETIVATLDHEAVSVRLPVETCNAWCDKFIEALQMFLEKSFLLALKQVHNTVEVTYDQHDVLTKHSQLVLLRKQASQGKWESD